MKSSKCVELSNFEKHILDGLLHNPKASQDEIWLKLNKKRLIELERGGYVKRKEQFWSLTPLGAMCAVAAERQLDRHRS